MTTGRSKRRKALLFLENQGVNKDRLISQIASRSNLAVTLPSTDPESAQDSGQSAGIEKFRAIQLICCDSTSQLTQARQKERDAVQ